MLHQACPMGKGWLLWPPITKSMGCQPASCHQLHGHHKWIRAMAQWLTACLSSLPSFFKNLCLAVLVHLSFLSSQVTNKPHFNSSILSVISVFFSFCCSHSSFSHLSDFLRNQSHNSTIVWTEAAPSVLEAEAAKGPRNRRGSLQSWCLGLVHFYCC